MTHARHSGFTYIELLVVVGLVSIILSFGLAMGMSSIGHSSVNQERDLFVSLLLSGARAQALANIGNVSHGIHIDNDNHQYILFDGDTYTEDAISNRTTSFTNEHITITHSENAENIVFERLSGDVSKGAGTISIIANNATVTIGLSSVGRINW